MKVLNLQCRHGHDFEGWFASDEDYRSQQERRLIACPLCAVTEISRMPSAPRLNLSGARPPKPEKAAEAQAPATATHSPGSPEAQLQSLWLQAVRHVMANTEDVGRRFAEEARRIHYGEAEARNIRGQATREDAQALSEEGIEIVALPVPDALKGPLQ